MQIAIVGAGWYGCHIASELLNNKNLSVSIYEENEIFSGISSYNQNRLHQGYHYPRSFQTRKESKEGFEQFIQKYRFLTKDCTNNYYAIHKKSIIDYDSYLAIFRQENYKFNIIKNEKENLSDYICVDEKIIDHVEAKKYFKQKLKKNIINKKFNVEDNSKYDLVIDTSCNRLIEHEQNLNFERFIYFIVKIKKKINPLIVMDGKFYSVFPILSDIDEDLFTLTNVELGVIANTKNFHTANNYYLTNSEEVELFEKSVTQYLEDIEYEITKNDIVLTEIVYSTKIKVECNNDERKVSIIKSNENIVTVIPGKIDAVFTAEKIIMGIINDTNNWKE